MPFIIDPPVSPYSPEREIRAWIARLESMDQGDEGVKNALEQAKGWLGGDKPADT